MPERNDPVDAWLNADVELLRPRPQAFQRISRRAKRRRTMQALSVAAGVAVIAAAAVSVPLAGLLPGGGASNINGPNASHSRTAPPSGTPTSPATSGPASRSATQITNLPPGTAISATTSGQPAPSHFRPTSVTFISQTIGAVIGQAGPPCYTSYCTSLAGTSSYGSSWYGVSAPLTGAPDAAAGVSQLRFLNLRYGWAFGPGLWYTTVGGKNWQRSSLQSSHPGLRVTDLETSNDVALAVAGTCGGGGPDFAADCTSFTLYRATAGSDAWRPVPGAEGLTAPGGWPTSASLVLMASNATPGNGTGYLLTPAGTIVSGGLGQASWRQVSTTPCRPGPAQAGGQPSGELLTSASGQLIVACAGSRTTSIRIYTWSVGAGPSASSWNLAGALFTGSDALTSLAAQPAGRLVLATGGGIEYSADGGANWRLAQGSPPGATPALSGFSYVGMTSPSNGVAVPADAALGELYVTTDGGRTWHPAAVR